jgi:putative transposase
MKSIISFGRKGKVKKAEAVEVQKLEEYGALAIDAKAALIQELIPLGLMHIVDVIKEEVIALAGDRYKRNGMTGYDRWGTQQGSVYIQDQRIPIRYQRVRDTRTNKEVSLRSYELFQKPTGPANDKLLKRVLYGLSCGNYRACSEAIPEALSLSRSTVSRRYISASEKKLREIRERKLDQHDFVALVMDGKRFGDDEIIISLGVTINGEKILLGIIQAASENESVCKDFLKSLIRRGLKYDQGLLCVMDGAKGFRKAVDEVFGVHGVVQRCQWHKRENILKYLPQSLQDTFQGKLQRAYGEESYRDAKALFQNIKKELRLINESAVNSLEEGFEETLTVHRLGVHPGLRRSFTTTNMIESVNALVGQRTDKVDYWKNSNQKQRWVATALLDIETKLNRVNGYRHLRELRVALQREIQGRLQKQNREEAVAA